MSSAARRFTYRELVKLPPSNLRHEIIQGSWFMTPPPIPDHCLVAARISTMLNAFSDPRGLGRVFSEVGLYFSETDFVQPDVVFLSHERDDRIRKSYLRGAPDLVVEVLSPSTRGLDRDEKLRLYRRRGLREYWLVDIDLRRIEVYDFARGRRVVASGRRAARSAVLPGFRVDPSAVFADLGA